MNQHDQETFAALMLGLGETYGENVSEARLEIYFQALRDMPLDAIRKAANLHVQSSKFFPRPAELREAINGNSDDAAELAWAWLVKEVRRVGWVGRPTWPDEATKRAAMQLYGSWSGVCETLPGEGPGLHAHAKQFKATFKSYAADDARRQLPTGNVVGYIGPTQ